jgi:anaerobic selenocysteine-containing dehydrogenase
VDRRHFIKLTAITGTTAALTACGNPENQIIRFIPEDDLTPGVATYQPSVCPMCSAGCGVIARVMDGDAEVFRNGQAGVIRMGLAKKLEGNPEDPISQGKLCARGQAAIQVTYHPDRIGKPRKRTGERGSGQFAEISWEEAIKELTGKLNELAGANDQGSLAFLTKPRRGRRLELVAELLQSYGARPAVTHEVFSDEVLRRANAMSFGSHQLPTYDLENARYVISFGADFLGTWNSAVAHSAAYGRMRQGRGGVRPKFVHVDARLSQTAANADEFVACKPGTEGLLAMALTGVIVLDDVKKRGAQADHGFDQYAPAKVAEMTGVPAGKIERLAREMATNGPAVAIIGGAPLAHTNGLFHARAVNALNRATNAVDQSGGLFFIPQGAPISTRPLKEILDTAPKVLLIDDVNPVFGSPASWKVADALKRVPFIASFGPFVDETSALADLILPDHSFLESWVDAAPESGSAKAVPTKFGPVMRPLHDTRSTPDVLLEIARSLGKPLAGLPASFEEFLNQEVTADVRRAGASAPAGSAGAKAPALQYVDPQFDGDASQYPYHFLPYASQGLYDGSLAHLPWLQEMPDPMTSGMWCSWVEINEQKARELGIAQGDLIEITSTQGSVRAPAFLNPGISPEAVAMPVGQGHTNFTRYATDRGVNPLSILAPTTIAETGTLAWSATRVKIAKVGDAQTYDSLILFGGATRERPDWSHGRGDEH